MAGTSERSRQTQEVAWESWQGGEDPEQGQHS